MSSCLGLYIETNLIKYAKVTKDKENIKVEAFGVKFYDSVGEAISQIIAETFSYKVPISINLSEEAYNYFYLFSLLNKNDLKKAIETEFDSFCYDKGMNRNALETRYVLVPDTQDKEKIKTIYISANKVEINRKLQELEGNKVSNISPLPLTITNVASVKSKENVMIVNIEDKTSITTIIDEKIYNVEKLEDGTTTILNNINEKENSYSKAYQICKNTTIYTMEGKDLQSEENLYLQDIMPTLYSIVEKVKDIVSTSLDPIDKIYLTGTGAMINNVDLYFQEYFKEVKCEILKPYFVPETVKINMKDYIEVNSAIALAMQGLGYGLNSINFKAPSFTDNLPDWLKLEVGSKKEKNEKTNKKLKFGNIKFDFNLKGKFDILEKWILRTCTGTLALIIIYIALTTFLVNQINNKESEINTRQTDMQKQISLVQEDITKLNSKTTRYDEMKNNLESYNTKLEEGQKTKNIIPILLTEIMHNIPQGVTITSIENTTGRHIVINAESSKYDLLGYFQAAIKTQGILTPSSVISTSGVKQDNVIKIVIEGDMP